MHAQERSGYRGLLEIGLRHPLGDGRSRRARDGCEERGRIHAVARHVRDRDDRRCSRPAPEQGDLSDAGPGPEPVDRPPVDDHLDLACRDHDEPVTRLTLGHQRSPGFGRHRLETSRDTLDRRHRKHGECRNLAEEADERLVDDRDARDAPDPEVHRDRDDREDQPAGDQRATRPEDPDQERGEEAARDRAKPDDCLEDRQDRRTILVGARPLEDREQGDVMALVHEERREVTTIAATATSW